MSMLEDLLAKKKASSESMTPEYKSAKMSMLQALKEEMGGMMKGDLIKPKSVSVSSDSPEGLKTGLEKAKEMLGKSIDSDESDDSQEGSDDVESPEADKLEGPVSDEMDSAEASMHGDDDDSHGLTDEELQQLEMLVAKAKRSKLA